MTILNPHRYLRYNRYMEQPRKYVPAAGRPRQPYCPDCKREGHFVLKKPGQGYCQDHQYARVRRNHERKKREANPNYVPPAERADVLVEDIRNNLAKGMPLTIEMIKAFYYENALKPPTDDELQALFFPGTIGSEYENLLDMAEQDRLVAELQKQAREANPYDPVD
jgi:hypothetical protein